MDLLLILISIGFGFFLGHLFAAIKFKNLIYRLAKEEGIDLEKEIKAEEKPITEVHKLEVEEIGNVLYLFDRETKDFVCQGSTVEELAKLCKEYKNIVAATVVHQGKVFMFVNGFSKEYTG